MMNPMKMLAVLMVLPLFANETFAQSKKEPVLDLLDIELETAEPMRPPYVFNNDDTGSIRGKFQSDSGEVFNFKYKIFTYGKNGNRTGALEGSSCAITDRKTGDVLSQGNFMFYFNDTSCCYDVKLISKKILVLSEVWNKNDSNPYQQCPTTNLKYIGD